jgi:thymidylate synthase
MIIENNSIGEIWLNAINKVLNEGNRIKYRNTELLEIINLQLIINTPYFEDIIIQKYGKKEILEYMRKNFQTDEDVGFDYTYKQRFLNYDGINQLEYSLKNFQKRENSMDAIFSTLKPKEDTKHIPCLALLQYIVRENTLIIFTTFKSQDIGKKSYADYIEILKLFDNIKQKLNVQDVKIISTISSAHIYQEDIEELKVILKNN